MSSRTIQITEPLSDYLARVGLRETKLLKALREETAAKFTGWRMQISPLQGQFMHMLALSLAPKRVVEVGTFTGYSALAVASALPEDATLVACDVSEEWTSLAKQYWEKAGVADRIDLRIGPAADTLDALVAEGWSNSVELAFIDADKENYDIYYEKLLRLLRPGGVILIDNVLWGGSIVDPSNVKPSTMALRALNEKIHADDRVDMVLIPIGDGVTMARKKTKNS